MERLSEMGSLSTEELYEQTRIPRSSVYRVASILESLGYLTRIINGGEHRWQIDLRFLNLSAGILNRLDVKTELKDVLVGLANDTKEIVQLAIYENGMVRIVDNVRKHRSIINVAHEGSLLPVNTCVAGFVFAAYMSDEELDALLEETELPQQTEFTITDKTKFKAAMVRVRKDGYAVDDQFYAIGHRCIGAPIFNHLGTVIAVINISGHVKTISDDKTEAFAAQVKQRAQEGSALLGYVPQAVSLPQD